MKIISVRLSLLYITNLKILVKIYLRLLDHTVDTNAAFSNFQNL